ncbi:uncharacterized protein [Phaseolus vulgaris]|uniref:uncharacterized protein n=1 Tax=Phaseolus vulgaris TaxID=3885 RepID=UPI0035C9C359
MGELDKDLCLFWKSVAVANITLPTASIITFEFLQDQLEAHIDNMLGKGKLAELRAIARSHKLAAGSQTVPNSVVEIAAAQGKTPPRGATSSGSKRRSTWKASLSPTRADLEAAKKADATKVENLEKRSDREVLLGKVEKERDDAIAELAKAREEATKIAAELAQARDEGKKAAEDLARAHEEKEELKKQAQELEQSTAQVLTAGFDAALEQVACQYPELDLSMVSICNEVVDGKIVPSED